MKKLIRRSIFLLSLGTCPMTFVSLLAQTGSLDPAKLPRLGTVDERFQSYNIEMLEVTGGKFWKPYSSPAKQSSELTAKPTATPSGMNPNLYEYRAPIDLSNTRLRKLAAALGPAYVRVSGTWANTTYFQNDMNADLKTPPAGFNGILTAPEWKGVVDFSKAVDAKIVTSVAVGTGARDAGGLWEPLEAQKVWHYTRSLGTEIAATEFMNEPNAPAMGGAPKGYDAVRYAKDFAVFRSFLKEQAPETMLLGPGSVGEGGALPMQGAGFISTADLLKATGPVFDVLSFHVYPAVSKRCASFGAAATTSAEAALSSEWLARPGVIEAFYAGLRDQYSPDKPLWITETADAACGGDPWASTFLDTFRYVNQLGSMAQRGVKVVMHNTLAASDYGLLSEKDFSPRPNFWAALLWRKLMGTTVLNPGPAPSENLHWYAQCLRGTPGGVALLVINADKKAARKLSLAGPYEEYALSARSIESGPVELNGETLELGANDVLPVMKSASRSAGTITLAPVSIDFIVIPAAGNPVCQSPL